MKAFWTALTDIGVAAVDGGTPPRVRAGKSHITYRCANQYWRSTFKVH